jgi:hypothetical protein
LDNSVFKPGSIALIALFVFIGAGFWVCDSDRRLIQQAKSWPTVKGTVVATDRGDGISYRGSQLYSAPTVTFTYSAEGCTFTSTQHVFLDHPFNGNANGQLIGLAILGMFGVVALVVQSSGLMKMQ